jgi:hypothetical protein
MSDRFANTRMQQTVLPVTSVALAEAAPGRPAAYAWTLDNSQKVGQASARTE